MLDLHVAIGSKILEVAEIVMEYANAVLGIIFAAVHKLHNFKKEEDLEILSNS